MSRMLVSSFLLIGLTLLLNPSVVAQDSSRAIPGEKCEPPVFKANEVSSRARITFKPEPTYTNEARAKNVQGRILLTVVLCKSGRVTDITVVEGLRAGLTEKAIDAASKIKFTPAEKDGQRVSQELKVEYSFNLFAGPWPRLARPPYAGRMIEAVGIMGLRTHESREIWNQFESRTGQAFSDEEIQADLRTLRALDYLDPKATAFRVEEGFSGGIKIMFQVKEQDGLGSPNAASPQSEAKDFWIVQPGTGIPGVKFVVQRPLISVSPQPVRIASDGKDLWVASPNSATVQRVRASDGTVLETRTGAERAGDVLVAMGRVFVVGTTVPGKLYAIDPRSHEGPVTTVLETLPAYPHDLAFDGARIWTANVSGSVSILTPSDSGSWTVRTLPIQFKRPSDILYDGTYMWVSDFEAGRMYKLDGSGNVIQTIEVISPTKMAFDGTNIWVPNYGLSTVTVISAATGQVVKKLERNGLMHPTYTAFDGENISVSNPSGHYVSFWRASDFTPVGYLKVAREESNTTPTAAYGDKTGFWICLSNSGKVVHITRASNTTH